MVRSLISEISVYRTKFITNFKRSNALFQILLFATGIVHIIYLQQATHSINLNHKETAKMLSVRYAACHVTLLLFYFKCLEW